MSSNGSQCLETPLLNIEYDLAQDIVMNERGPLEHDDKICEQAILLWKKYLAYQVSCLKRGDPSDHIHSKYNFRCWFEKGNNEIFENMSESVETQNELDLLEYIITNIGEEIHKFIKIIKKNCCLNNNFFLSLLENLYFTRMRTVDYMKSSTFLIRNTDLKNEDKYEIACYFCLNESSEYFNLTKDLYGTEFTYDETTLLRVFWTFFYQHRREEFDEEITRNLREAVTSNEHMLRWAIRNENEVAVYCFWENFCKDEEKQRIKKYVKYCLNHHSTTNILCYLISKLRQKEDKDSICAEDGYLILNKLFSDLRWRPYFKKAFECVKLSIVKMTFLKALKTRIMSWLEVDSEKKSRISTLEELGIRYSVDINVTFIFSSDDILNILLVIDDEEVIRNFLNKSYDGLKTSDNIDHIVIPIGEQLRSKNKNKSKLFRTFIQWLFPGEELQEFKIKFSVATGCEVKEI